MSLDVDICDNEKCTRELGKMVEAMKGAVGMDTELRKRKFCEVSTTWLLAKQDSSWPHCRRSKQEHEQRAIPFGLPLNVMTHFSSMGRCDSLPFVWLVTIAHARI